MKKLLKKKIIVLMLLFAFLFPSVALGAVTVLEQSGNIFAGAPYLDSANNRYTVDFVGTSVAKITLQSWNDDFSIMGNEVTVNATDHGYTYMVGSNFTCNVPYKAYYYDSSNNQIGYLKLVVSGLTEPALCDSGGSGATVPTEECSTVVCECIEQLKDVLHGDNLSTGVKLDELASIGNQIKTEIGSLHDEFQTDIDYSATPIYSTNVPAIATMPDVSNLLEQNKPVQNTTPYKNDEIKFSDGGDAEIPGALPTPPDVKDWDGFTPESALPPDGERTKDGQMNSEIFTGDAEMTKDVSNQDAEMTKDVSSQDAEMTKDVSSQDAEMNKEIFSIEPIMSIEQMQSTDSYGKTHVYQQTNVFP